MLKSISAATLSILFLCSCVTVNADGAYSGKASGQSKASPNRAAERASKGVTYKLGMDPADPSSYCGGTAVGPSALLTVKHCAVHIAGTTVTLDGREHEIKTVILDDLDGGLVVFKHKVFDRWADIAKAPSVGDEVYMWGNSLFDEFLRRGYVSTRVWDKPFMDIPAGTGWMVVDIQVSGGDSGSGIFNRHGQLVATLTGFQGSRTSVYAVCMPFAFDRDAIRPHVPNPKHLSPR